MKPPSALETKFIDIVKAAGLSAGCNREVQFHPSRKWRFDLAWIEDKVAVEVEGGTWVRGAHTQGGRFDSDAEKYAEAAILGWVVVRVSSSMIRSGMALDLITRALESRRVSLTQ